ncbi:MAG: ABC transporter permease [Oscillospiraceae bacterium]|nr:ABC transporter permease [Oscillospiraceae bacterium]
MFKTIFGLAFQGTKRRKRQSLLIFFVLLITFAFAVMLLSYTNSIAATNQEYRFSIYGSWYGSIAYGQDGDAAYLESTGWAESVGESVNYGTVSGRGIGTVDEAFVGMGISLEEGTLPKNSGEVAVEVSVLNSLGYDYTIGDTITLPITISDDETVYRNFTLVGVISTYTTLWDYSETLNSVIITEEDAEAIFGDATPDVSYFFTVRDGLEDTVSEEVNAYLSESRGSSVASSRKTVKLNSYAYLDNSETEFNSIYIWLIFAVAILAVVVVYILQMQPEIRRTVRVRSLGGSKGQLRLLVAIETLIICIPSLLMGIIVGAIGIWILLRVSVFSGSVAIIVSMPWKSLAMFLVLWILGTLLVKMVIFQIAIATPLTGRMEMQTGKQRFSLRFQKGLIIAMCVVFCSAVIFTTVFSLEPYYSYSYYSGNYSYQAINTLSYSGQHLQDDIISEIASIPGVSDVWGYTEVSTYLTTDDVGLQEVSVYVVDSSDSWDDMIDFTCTDLESFNSGDSVILMKVSTDTESVIPAAGDEITLTISGTEITTTVGGISNYYRTSGLGYNYSLYPDTYDLVCSVAFVQKVLDAVPEGTTWGYYYTAGDTAGFSNVLVFTDLNAEYLSTDKTLAKLFTASSLMITENNRDYNSSKAREYLQTLIMFLVSGGCIAFITLLILGSTIRLETEREKKKYGILQAIGMSRGQRNIRLLLTSVIRGAIASISGWAVYFGYMVYKIRFVTMTNADTMSRYEELGLDTSFVGILERQLDSLASYHMETWTMVLTAVVLFVVVFVVCYISKLSLNKYKLMEMLQSDR